MLGLISNKKLRKDWARLLIYADKGENLLKFN